jgi:hypothetical protein
MSDRSPTVASMNQPFERDRYDRALAEGAEEYRDIIDILGLAGLTSSSPRPAGCALRSKLRSMMVTIHLLITDADEPLAWYRTEKRGWGVGIYETEDASEAVWFETTEQNVSQACC